MYNASGSGPEKSSGSKKMGISLASGIIAGVKLRALMSVDFSLVLTFMMFLSKSFRLSQFLRMFKVAILAFFVQ